MALTDWLAELKYDPLKTLTASGNEAVAYFARRDLRRRPGPGGCGVGPA